MQAIKLVTFDATNTLLKFRIPAWQYYGIVAREFGFTGSDDTLKVQMKEGFKIMQSRHPNFGKNDVHWQSWWREIVKLTFKGQLPASADIDTIASRLIDEFKTDKCWTIAHKTPELLNLLKNNRIIIGVVSNFDPRLNDILCNIHLHNHFDFILTSYEVGYSKPDKRIFESALKASQMSVKPSEALHIGDNLEKDYNGARKAGWHALLIACDLKLEIPPANSHVFSSIEDLYIAVNSNKIKL